MQPGFWGFLKQGGILQGYPFAGKVWYVGTKAPVFGARANTIQNAVNLMNSRDILFVGPGSHDEAVVIPAGLNLITIIGAGNRGSVGIAPSTSGAKALTITGTSGSSGRNTGITLVNLDLEGNGAGGGLLVKGNIRSTRVYGCKCEGGAYGIRLESDANGSVADTIIDDCELAWTVTALNIAVSGGGDPVTQTRFLNSLLHNYSSRGIYAPTVQTADIWVQDNFFGINEDASLPTNEIISLAVASTTGLISGNKFAIATNAVAKFAIAAGVLWSANATEAGWSTARPA